jgi:hypothetical protein
MSFHIEQSGAGCVSPWHSVWFGRRWQSLFSDLGDSPLHVAHHDVLLDETGMTPSLVKPVWLGGEEDKGRCGPHLELAKQLRHPLQVGFDDYGVVLEFVGNFVDDPIHDLTRLTPVLHEIDEDRFPFGHQFLELRDRVELSCFETLLEKTHFRILGVLSHNLESIACLPAYRLT